MNLHLNLDFLLISINRRIIIPWILNISDQFHNRHQPHNEYMITARLLPNFDVGHHPDKLWRDPSDNVLQLNLNLYSTSASTLSQPMGKYSLKKSLFFRYPPF